MALDEETRQRCFTAWRGITYFAYGVYAVSIVNLSCTHFSDLFPSFLHCCLLPSEVLLWRVWTITLMFTKVLPCTPRVVPLTRFSSFHSFWFDCFGCLSVNYCCCWVSLSVSVERHQLTRFCSFVGTLKKKQGLVIAVCSLCCFAQAHIAF